MSETAPLAADTLRQMLADSPFIRFCGMELVDAKPNAGELELRMPLRDELRRMPGSAQFHGGPIAALIDTAGCFALVMQTAGPVPTVNFRTDYLRPAVDTTLFARARVRRVGRSVGVVDVEVHDADARLVALGRGTFGTGG